MKGIAIFMVFLGVIATIVVSIFHWQPIPFLIDYYADRTGRYPVAQVYGLTGLLFMLPGAIVMMIDNAIEKFRKKK